VTRARLHRANLALLPRDVRVSTVRAFSRTRNDVCASFLTQHFFANVTAAVELYFAGNARTVLSGFLFLRFLCPGDGLFVVC
jgi:hypothetical protein